MSSWSRCPAHYRDDDIKSGTLADIAPALCRGLGVFGASFGSAEVAINVEGPPLSEK